MMEKGTCSEYITFSTKDEGATLFACNIVNQLSGVSFEVKYQGDSYHVNMQTPGEFSVYNGLSAMGALLALHVPIEAIIEALAVNSRIKGRFQSVESPNGYTAIVDYAHAPDGLENVLNAMKDCREPDHHRLRMRWRPG